MQPSSSLYFTYNHAEVQHRARFKDFAYPFSFFESLAEKHGMVLEDRSKSYSHPRAERMVKANLRAS